jgi:hypothetical protein
MKVSVAGPDEPGSSVSLYWQVADARFGQKAAV